MSFGLLTAINVDDLPKILRRCARGWRAGVYSRYPQTWKLAADEVDRFANELQVKIEELKKTEPKPPRRRAFL